MFITRKQEKKLEKTIRITEPSAGVAATGLGGASEVPNVHCSHRGPNSAPGTHTRQLVTSYNPRSRASETFFCLLTHSSIRQIFKRFWSLILKYTGILYIIYFCRLLLDSTLIINFHWLPNLRLAAHMVKNLA